MKRLILVPDGWPCALYECRPGLFMFDDTLCLRDDYGGFYIAENGDAFWGGTPDKEHRAKLEVQPVKAEWEEYEE